MCKINKYEIFKIIKWLFAKIIIVVIIIIACCVVYLELQTENKKLIDIGTFVILTLTLIALIIYAYDTNLMASIANERWKRASILNTTYSMNQSTSNKSHTIFQIYNQSNLVVKAKVRCNFLVYGEPVTFNSAFEGKEVWCSLPYQSISGWFDIEKLLAEKNYDQNKMIQNRTDANRATQLTMNLEIEYRDELDNERKLPSVKHFFDFKELRWIPCITQKEGW